MAGVFAARTSYTATGQRAVTLCGRDGNRGSVVALVMSYRFLAKPIELPFGG